MLRVIIVWTVLISIIASLSSTEDLVSAPHIRLGSFH